MHCREPPDKMQTTNDEKRSEANETSIASQAQVSKSENNDFQDENVSLNAILGC